MNTKKPRDLSDADILSTSIGGKTVAQWIEAATPLVGGLLTPQPGLLNKMGLVIFYLNGQPVFVGSATDKQGGLGKRLGQLRSKSTGAKHHAATRLREHAAEADLTVIVTGWGKEAAERAVELRECLRALWRPAWNDPRSTSELIARAKAKGKGNGMAAPG